MTATGELEPLSVNPPPLAGPSFEGIPGPALPPTGLLDPRLTWLGRHPNSAVTDPNPRDHRCQPGQVFLPYFGCKDHPHELPPPPPPPPPPPNPGSSGCAGGINIPGLGCIEPPSLPSPPQLPSLPPLPPILLPV